VKGAIASVEIFVGREGEQTRRLSLTITQPERAEGGEGWCCRVALANLHRPCTVSGQDSVEVLAAALARSRGWLSGLIAEGFVLTRDRAGRVPFEPF
jgi:hypothetical protein